MTISSEQVNVLVVDNNPVLLKALTSILIKEGCNVKTADNGLEALDVLREWPVNIVFSDLVMPLVEGDVLCRIIKSKEQYKNILVAILSAIVSEDRDRILSDVPCDLCFEKGSIVEMKQQVKETLESYHKGYVRQKDWSEKKPINFDSYSSKNNETTITQELLAEKGHLRRILEDLAEGILELNSSGKIVRANSAVAKIFSRSQEDMIGLPLSEVIPWSSYQKEVESWIQEQLVNEGQQTLTFDETEPLSINDKWVTADFSVVRSEDGCFGIGIIHDITRQYLAEKHQQEVDSAIELMKKMEAMRGMAGGVAHDFNNLLTVICGNLDIVLADSNSSSLSKDETTLIENARKASLVAVDLTRTISCFSNFGIVHRVDYDLNNLVKNCSQKFFNEQQLSHKFKLSDLNFRVQVDPTEIELVVCNILENSVEALEGKDGVITITSEKIDWQKPHLLAGQYIPAGVYAKVDIRDKGPGIKSQFLSQVFDPYYSSKERSSVKGMGLGLAVVYSVMRNHGGYAVVDSVVNEGTTVSLFFPVYQEKDKSLESKQSSNGDKVIILIESDSQLRELGRIMLEYLGYTVESFENPILAIEHIKESHETGKLPEVILFEISELEEAVVQSICSELKKIHPAGEIVGISGAPLDPIMENCRKYGMSNTLSKPYTLDSLKHVLKTAQNIQ